MKIRINTGVTAALGVAMLGLVSAGRADLDEPPISRSPRPMSTAWRGSVPTPRAATRRTSDSIGSLPIAIKRAAILLYRLTDEGTLVAR